MARFVFEEPGLQGYIAQVESYAVLTREEELELARRWRDHADRRAADMLVVCHLRAAVRIARKYRGYGIPLSDLVAEGNLGLLEAVRRFEPERGLRFLTYARYWVRAYILAYVLKQWSIVDMGTTAQQSKLFFRLQGEHARLLVRLGDGDDSIDAQLADKFGTSQDHVRASLQRLGRRDSSLDAPIVSDGSVTMVEMLSDESVDQEESAAAAELVELVQETVAAVMPRLDEREQRILRERLLPEVESRSLADLGREIGITRERVRQIEAGVKRKLRNALEQRMNPRPAGPRGSRRQPLRELLAA
jgi:RNA polymerase sigma-32 factor